MLNIVHFIKLNYVLRLCLCVTVFLQFWAPDCAHAMEPYTPEPVYTEENIEIALVEELPAEEIERIMVENTEIAHTVVVGTVILLVFVVSYLIPTTG